MRVLGKIHRSLTQGSLRNRDLPDNTRHLNGNRTDANRKTWTCFGPFTMCLKKKKNFLKIRKPEKKSHILIPHNRADKPEGDDFGAYLCTFKDKLKDGSVYYRHFLVDIDDAGPADQMKIDNNDEMVLLNENFVPELTHNEVLALFRDVKVDGISRFTLVLRRVRAKKWEWIETSAILAPDKHTDDHPVVERVEFKELRGERIEVPKSKHLYKVPGTQQYLDICDGKVSIDTLKHDDSDRTKIITKRAKYWQDDGDQIHINFAAALCDEEMKWYIGIDRDKVVLKREPVWFKMIKVGSKIRFQFNKRYLGYDLENDEVKPEVSQCVFAELPASAMNIEDPPSHSEDYIPENTERMSEAPSEKSHHSSIASSLSSIHLDNRSVASSQTSVDSDNSSILSSQVSTDSGGAFAEFHRSFSGTDSCGEQSSLSQASTTSDYRSDNYTEEDMTVCKPTDMLLSEPEKSKKDLMTAPSPQVNT
ncbi:uncharacterized protein LOC123554445 isoform X2 [Mercenaria mercenaria]|uniref:uncharacterized protein LOC123554445 isoform X2 n=1 Tax=Mercenaria mercenaria TaxID=6596 RepID=UPI00234E8EAC|nr:uncharacterized protein LOC123554445 isoform X2 [Mercenaria mercenaria]